jgi:hypothetical protein
MTLLRRARPFLYLVIGGALMFWGMWCLVAAVAE